MEDDNLVKTHQFSIRVRKGDWEIEVSAPDKSFVLDESNRLIEHFKSNKANSSLTTEEVMPSVTTLPVTVQTKTSKPQALNEFFRQFKLQTHLDKILVLGYWCEVKQHQPHFTSEDILTKYKEAKEPAPANIRRDIGTLLSRGLLQSTGKAEDGTLAYALTNTGEKEVESKIPQ